VAYFIPDGYSFLRELRALDAECFLQELCHPVADTNSIYRENSAAILNKWLDHITMPSKENLKSFFVGHASHLLGTSYCTIVLN
jgi:hypothetical protein